MEVKPMDTSTIQSFGRKIKRQVIDRRGVLVRMTLTERDQVRFGGTQSSLSLQQYCLRRLLGESSAIDPKSPTPAEN